MSGVFANHLFNMDGMFFKIKDDGRCVSKCIYNILSIDQEGKKEVLGFYLAESEDASSNTHFELQETSEYPHIKCTRHHLI